MPTLSHQAVILAVADLDANRNYFTQQLGFRIHFQAGDPVYYLVLKRDGITINLSLSDELVKAPSHPSAYIFCTEAAVLYTEFKDKGVSFAEELNDTDYGMREFVVNLPSGHRLVFGQGGVV